MQHSFIFHLGKIQVRTLLISCKFNVSFGSLRIILFYFFISQLDKICTMIIEDTNYIISIDVSSKNMNNVSFSLSNKTK